MSFTPASKALARFKVLDLTRVRAGPTAARQFADWGADVIKIELPRGLDESDMGGPRQGPSPVCESCGKPLHREDMIAEQAPKYQAERRARCDAFKASREVSFGSL
jgi:hypothetical protein